MAKMQREKGARGRGYMSRIKFDLTGEIFGRLLAIQPTDRRVDKKIVWEFLCDCGKTHYAVATHVKSGHIRSCGCLAIDVLVNRNTKHGATSGSHKKRPLSYRIWVGMIARCTHSWHKNWNRYGGRGISVCARWQDYPNFLSDMGEPDKNMTIERIDNSGNYEPANCMWATRLEQAQNTSRNVYIEHNGKRQTMAMWAREFGMSTSSFWIKINRGVHISEIINKDIDNGK